MPVVAAAISETIFDLIIDSMLLICESGFDIDGMTLLDSMPMLLRRKQITLIAVSPHDNAVIESFFSCLKSESIHLLPKIKAKEMIAEVEKCFAFGGH